MPTDDTATRFEQLVDMLTGEPGVTAPEGGRAFGGNALKTGGRIFAMLAGGTLVVKLPAARVAAAIAAGDGGPFTAGKDRPMREWLSVAPDRPAVWEPLAREALAFVSR
ncbi:MAG TPA: TfoX/Sxy family protein [Dactylosporangium sp.]|jgi:hypothetical protein|nr:TfoX/Sxy family protein [Dactylosporangium sp.]